MPLIILFFSVSFLVTVYEYSPDSEISQSESVRSPSVKPDFQTKTSVFFANLNQQQQQMTNKTACSKVSSTSQVTEHVYEETVQVADVKWQIRKPSSPTSALKNFGAHNKQNDEQVQAVAGLVSDLSKSEKKLSVKSHVNISLSESTEIEKSSPGLITIESRISNPSVSGANAEFPPQNRKNNIVNIGAPKSMQIDILKPVVRERSALTVTSEINHSQQEDQQEKHDGNYINSQSSSKVATIADETLSGNVLASEQTSSKPRSALDFPKSLVVSEKYIKTPEYSTELISDTFTGTTKLIVLDNMHDKASCQQTYSWVQLIDETVQQCLIEAYLEPLAVNSASEDEYVLNLEQVIERNLEMLGSDQLISEKHAEIVDLAISAETVEVTRDDESLDEQHIEPSNVVDAAFTSFEENETTKQLNNLPTELVTANTEEIAFDTAVNIDDGSFNAEEVSELIHEEDAAMHVLLQKQQLSHSEGSDEDVYFDAVDRLSRASQVSSLLPSPTGSSGDDEATKYEECGVSNLVVEFSRLTLTEKDKITSEVSAIETTEVEQVLTLLPPFFTTPLPNITATDGQRTTLTCCVAGQPLPEVAWYVDREPVKESSDDFSVSFAEGVCSLTIWDTLPEDEGEYSVKAVNEAGECTTAAYLTVIRMLSLYSLLAMIML